MNSAPRGSRLHVGIFGARNAGKSSLLNALTKQDVAIVSPEPGTTTDPVEKPMELLPVGPVVFIDTAGVDDEGALGEARVKRTLAVVERCDVALLVASEGVFGRWERELLARFDERKIPTLVIFNKHDLASPAPEVLAELKGRGLRAVTCVASRGEGISAVRQGLIALAPESFIDAPALVYDLVPPGETAVLVVPIDTEAPKGRLILPQVQAIRDLLDGDACCLVVKERELRLALDNLKKPPALVITDSQAFLRVAGDVPDSVPLTGFSILFARAKGDLATFVEGARAIDKLHSGSRVLIAEACSHHPIGEDIGRVKIPRWLTQYVGGKLEIDHAAGCDFPADLARYDLVVHCGSCTLNRRAMLARVAHCRDLCVPITNYGMCIAYSLGIFERALAPFRLGI